MAVCKCMCWLKGDVGYDIADSVGRSMIPYMYS
jgi:hypothetical protein